MSRTPRLKIDDETAVYHIMSRTALDGFPMGDIEKDFMLDLIKRYSSLYLIEILGFCLMGNHFHLLVKMFPGNVFSDEDTKKRGSWGEICESANRACLKPCSSQAIGVMKIHGPHDWPHEPKTL